MVQPVADAYNQEWAEGTDEAPVPTEEQARVDALKQLASIAHKYVDESITARNQTDVPHEIRRSYELYNAVGLKAADATLEHWEGTRTAVSEGSKVVQNIIRQITNDGCSQLGDLLYPTDQDNYGLNPVYPSKPPLKLQAEQATDGNGEPIYTEDPETGEQIPVTWLQEWRARKAALDHKTERMKQKIDGTLDRVQFGKLGRQLIESAGQTGTGIIKGPFADPNKDRRWAKTEGNWDLHQDQRQQACYSVVSPIDFLPDMTATKVEDCAYVSTREWYLPRQLRKLLNLGYNDDEINALIKRKPTELGQEGDGDNELRMIRDKAVAESMYGKRYEVFDTWSDYPRELFEKAGVKGLPEGEMVFGCVIHCAGYCLKAYAAPQQASTDMIFSVWCWDDDPNGIFGKSIPLLAENCQLTYNAVWRMILDHGGLGAVPMVAMMKSKVSPWDGSDDYGLRGGKRWVIEPDIFSGAEGRVDPFQVFDIPIKLNEFFAILEKAEEDAYKLTGVTRVEKNQQGVDNAPVTLGATQIFQNNSSVSRRRQVRNFDDDITKSVMTRQYNWHMELEEDDDIKGNMTIEPRGSSVLMQREVNTQNLIQFYQVTNGGTTPGSKSEAMLRAMSESMQFPLGKFVETQAETEERKQLEAQNPPEDPALQIEKVKLEIKEAEVEQARLAKEADIEVRMAEVQGQQQIAVMQIELKSIADERHHVREMLRLEQMSEQFASTLLAKLDQQETDAINKAADIKAKRDIAASSALTKEAVDDRMAGAKELEAVAKKQTADNHKRELEAKLSGAIEEGV